jgi:hypothetical protein
MIWKRRFSKNSSKNSSHETKRENNSSKDTHMKKNKASTGKKRKQLDHLEGEFKKINPSTFDGESKTGEEVEAWLLDIKKYFHIYNYSSNMKVRMAIYNLKGKASIWWQDLKLVKGLKEKGWNGQNSKSISRNNTYQKVIMKERLKNFMNCD